jgi:uncharacterized protein
MTGLLTDRNQLKHSGPQAVSALTPPLDRPWRRPGAFRYALGRLRGIARPPVFVTKAPGDIVNDRDAAVWVRDGTVLRANVFRGPGAVLCPRS